ncbi:hypothetical protein EXA18_00620 [Vibrio cincinnatiensis]|uniref:hypothetical protein n=1 Tax=Vibrio cincinnatiensis TaxID=675 RepID=UPI001EDD37D8|nr:hypothetical protein [Vibrio cincinnatiensis]MCG3741986.1 hypothetical protein [Vibrio cincinnatiensis]
MFTPDQLKQLKTIYNGINSRCGKGTYSNVQNEFNTFQSFTEFIEKEVVAGRDYFEMKADGKFPEIARRFDTGNYSAINCQILTRTQNRRDARAEYLEVFDSTTNTTSLFKFGLCNLFKTNQQYFDCSYSTLYRLVKKGLPISITNGLNGCSGYLKINIINK